VERPFSKLYNSVPCDNDAVTFKNALAAATDCCCFNLCQTDGKHNSKSTKFTISICLAQVETTINKLKVGKSPGPDGIPSEACKGKDLSDISNYRAITLSNSITKVLECVFLDHVNDSVYH